MSWPRTDAPFELHQSSPYQDLRRVFSFLLQWWETWPHSCLPAIQQYQEGRLRLVHHLVLQLTMFLNVAAVVWVQGLQAFRHLS